MLVALTTHPIQYQAPLWKATAARKSVPFAVLFLSDHGLRSQRDPGFERTFSWDVDLVGGYQHEFLPARTGSRQDSFWWLRLPADFAARLRAMGARALWLQGWQVAAYWQAALAARRAGVQVWLRGETNVRSNQTGRAKTLKRVLLRRLFKHVDRFLYIGEANRRFYRQMGVGDQQLVAAPYCVDNERFAVRGQLLRAERLELRKRWQIPSEAFCVLVVGKLIGIKRPGDIIDAAVKLRQLVPHRPCHILWAGSGPLELTVRSMCSVAYPHGAPRMATGPNGDGPVASFAGFLNQSEISEAYAAADCLVLASQTETWGLVVNEAMASGLPCVVSDGCGCAEDLVLPLRPDLCFPMGDVESLARSLLAVMNDPPSPARLQAHIAGYDVQRTVESVEACYEAGVAGA